MRLLSRVATATLVLASLTGCGLILGSFTTDGSTGKDGGTTDGGANDGATDANPDAPQPPKPLSCVIDGTPHKTGYTAPPDPEDQPLLIHALQGPDRRFGFRTTVNTRRRVLVNDVKSDGTGLNPILMNLPVGADVIALGNYEGGLAFLDFDTGTASISAWMLADNTQTPTTPIAVPFADAVPANPTAFAAAIVPLDIANGVFFVAVAWGVNNQPQMDLYAGAVRVAGGGPLLPPLVKMGTVGKLNFESDDVLLDRNGKRATILLSPNQGIGQAQAMDLSWGPSPAKPVFRDLAGVNGGKVILGGAGPSVATAGTNLALFLSGDLAQPQIPFGFVSGSIADDKITTLDLATMPPQVQFPSIDDLAVDKGNIEFRFFPQVGPQSLIVGRFTGTGAGVNLLWFDATGVLRGRASGATTLVPNANVAGAAGTFRSPPTAIFAALSVVWKTDAKDIFIADVTCK